jgi:glycosyltransferase involved in cell wall biosynthesis
MIPPRSVGKVLMTADSVGGVWTYALQLAGELGRRGVEVTLLVMGGKPSADQAEEAARLPNLSLIGTDFRLEWMSDPDADLALAGELLLELEAERRPDVVHLNGFCHATLPFKAPVLVAAHSCVASWWRACRRTPLPREWSRYAERVAAGIAAADMVVAPTAAYLRELTALHGAPREARAIWNGRDLPLAAVPKRQMVLAAGRLWDEAKNIRTLCGAADGLPWPVMIAGDATAPSGATIETPPNVLWLGRLRSADLAARMGEAPIFAAPARYEPFGLAILEAALSGCALVLGDIPTLRELWNGAARFVPPEDAAALRAALGALQEDASEVAALGGKARQRARTYTATRMGEAYLEAYENLAAGRVVAFPHAALRASA